MPTFNRTPFDPAKPQTYDGTNQSTVPLTADQRAQHANGNTAFSAAHDDVAALESGKADQTALDAHTGAANPHSGSAAKASPATAGNVAQLDASGDLVDSTIPSDKVARLDQGTPAQVWDAPQRFPANSVATDAWFTSGGAPINYLQQTDAPASERHFGWRYDGTTMSAVVADAALAVQSNALVLGNGSSGNSGVIVGAGATGGFRGTGTINVSGGYYVNGVELTPGGGGVTTFVGLSDTPNDYTAANGFLTRVNAGATALEYVDGTALFQTKPGSATAGVLTRYKVNGELEESGIASADVSAHLASTANPHSVTAAQVGALTQVAEDTTPALGGNLLTEGNTVTLTRVDSSFHGVLAAMTTRVGAALAYSPDGSSFDLADGAVAVEPGAAHLYGASAIVEGLTHAETAGRQVYVSQSGVLYGVDAPEPGWSDTASDATSTARAGAVGAWQQLTGLTTTIAQDLTAGRLNIEATVWTVNNTTNRSGTVEIGYGIGAAQPTSGVPKFVPESFSGYVTLSLSPDLTETAGTDIGIWVRVTQESNPAFSSSLAFDGTANNHAARIATPGAGGGGGSGDVVQGAGGATGEVAVWQDFAGKLVHGTGIAATAVLRNDASATVGSAVGYAATTATQASGGTYTPSPLNGQYVELTGSTATTIGLMTVDGAVSIGVPDGLALTLTGWTVVGDTPSGRVGILECRKVGTMLIAAWV